MLQLTKFYLWPLGSNSQFRISKSKASKDGAVTMYQCRSGCNPELHRDIKKTSRVGTLVTHKYTGCLAHVRISIVVYDGCQMIRWIQGLFEHNPECNDSLPIRPSRIHMAENVAAFVPMPLNLSKRGASEHRIHVAFRNFRSAVETLITNYNDLELALTEAEAEEVEVTTVAAIRSIQEKCGPPIRMLQTLSTSKNWEALSDTRNVRSRQGDVSGLQELEVDTGNATL